MTQISDQLQIKCVDISQIVLHEFHDSSRLGALVEKIKATQVMRNPIILLPLGEIYLLLDGAHRLNALKTLGSQHVAAQVVSQTQFTVEAWCHVTSTASFSLDFQDCEHLTTDPLIGRHKVASIHHSGQTVEVFTREGADRQLLLAYWELSDRYADGEYVRCEQVQFNSASEVCVEYTPVPLECIRRLAGNHWLLPPGLTRILVHDRILHLNVPLTLLLGEQAQTSFPGWLADRVCASNLRSYGESVRLFE